MVGLFATLEGYRLLCRMVLYANCKSFNLIIVTNLNHEIPQEGLPACRDSKMSWPDRSSTTVVSTLLRLEFVIQLCHHLHITEEFYCGLV